MLKRIKNLEQLEDAISRGRAVICPKTNAWKKPRPAAVLMMQQGGILLALFRSGMFEYEKKAKGLE